MHTKYLFTILFISLISIKKSLAQETSSPKPAVLNHIAVYVTDLKKSTDFYENIFKLKIVPEPFKDGKHTWFSLGTVGNLHLIQGAKPNQIYDKNEHLCFSVPSVDEFVTSLKRRDIKFENWVGAAQEITLRVDGVKQVYFKDPDGHWLEVNDAK
ncbi:VOC family protein [Pedobacter mucosus]|uniref:VOC family protein n=1 Tax=Pedobacter mucosus TaxID=2895286 RepID=UPI001EE4BB9D|nr:VOC family protein [Pedobacter mucosus]UKT65712.1 VOC family protein [Pedobacter mucosus]